MFLDLDGFPSPENSLMSDALGSELTILSTFTIRATSPREESGVKIASSARCWVCRRSSRMGCASNLWETDIYTLPGGT